MKCEMFPCLSLDSAYRAFAVAARACKGKKYGGENSPCRKKTDKVMGAVGGMFWRGGFIFFMGFLPADSFWRAWRNAGNPQLVHVTAGFIFHQQRICLQPCGVLGSRWEILAFPKRTGWLRTPPAAELDLKVAPTSYLHPQIQGAVGK